MITLALSKGRILKDTLPLLAKLGIHPTEDLDKTRKLIIPTTREDVQLLVVRATDVPVYVAHGGADMGVVGKDVLMEQGGDNQFELLDLKIARCKLMVAAPVNHQRKSHRLRVATKYVNIAQDYFASKGEQVDLIKLYGSMELAPLVGMADCIVDLVDTGNTLRANGLEATEHIAEISSRLVVNGMAYKRQYNQLQGLVDDLAQCVAQMDKE
ncbi:MAG: ATP phosphoribosyltransferase [Thiotrichales bacterium]|jgi:ATP phosphoribosyltransferase|nr:ATP phosphoribosyltransferase [Pseudomonadota bacterium]MCI4410308.1 ATP phosphoribosyltransferase [Thiotrichales bacterium]